MHLADIDAEESIVWLEDPSRYPYVRELDHIASFRSRKPRFDLTGRMIGYATLRQDAKGYAPGCFYRRVFWVKPYDRSEDPNGVYAHGSPIEAVDPSTVAAGVAGTRPSCCRDCSLITLARGAA